MSEPCNNPGLSCREGLRILLYNCEQTVGTCYVSGYSFIMIKGFKHKGLKLFFEAGKASGININHQRRVKNILALLETAETIEDMNLPGLKLHELKVRQKAPGQ